MKKTSIFLTSALIVMAILAGCSDTVAITGLPQNVKSGTINQIGDFLTGQTFDPKKFTVDITYDNGHVITDDGSVTVQLDSGNTVKRGSTVSANIGQNVDGIDVYATGSVAVYDINRIEVTGPAEIASETNGTTVNVPASALTVTAYYLDSENAEQSMVLSSGEYTVGNVSLGTNVKLSAAYPSQATTAKVTPLVGQSKLPDADKVTGTFSFTATYPTAAPEKEIVGITSVSWKEGSTLLALDYGTVPAPSFADVNVGVQYVDGTKESLKADPGITFKFVDHETGRDLTATKLTTDMELDVVATYGELTKRSATEEGVTPTAAKLRVTPVSVNADGEFLPLVTGEAVGTADSADFIVDLGYGVVGSETWTYLDSADVEVAYVDSNDEETAKVIDADAIVGTDPTDIYALATYMGVTGYVGGDTATALTPVTKAAPVPVSVKDIVLTDTAKAAIPAAQYYNTGGWTAITINNTAIESYTVVFSDGSEVSSTDTENPLTGSIIGGVAYYLDNAGKEPLADVEPVASTDAAYNADYADTTPDGAYYDALANADQIYVQVAYTEGEDPDDVTAYGYLGVDLQTAYASSMLAAAEYEFDEPMYGSDITTLVRLVNDKGVVDPDFTDYDVLGPDGQPGKIPTTATLVADGAEVYTVYAFVKQATGVDVKVEETVSIEPAVDYIKVSKFNIDFKKNAEGEYTAFALIGSDVEDIDETADLAITGWDHAIKDGEADEPTFTIVAPTAQTVGASTELKANVTYTNEEGDEVTEQIAFTLKGTAYTVPVAGGFAFKFEDVVYGDNDELPAGRYSFNLNNLDPESYTEYGDDKNFKIESVTVEGEKQTGTTVTVDADDEVVISITYTDGDTGKLVEAAETITLTGVAVEPDEP